MTFLAHFLQCWHGHLDQKSPGAGSPCDHTLRTWLDERFQSDCKPRLAISSADLRERRRTPSVLVSILAESLAGYPDKAVWISLLPHGELLKQTAAVEKRKAAGEDLPLYGIPFGVKDSIDVAGQPTTGACPSYAFVPEQSSPVVQKIINAGAIYIGKTNLDQLGCGLMGDRSAYGDCRNVFNRDYVSGGSSSGSAVAVAAGMVSFALGTDTAGSGRVPAGCNNIVGLKPAVGTFSTAGIVPSCPSLDGVSFLTLTSDDALTVFDVARGRTPRAQVAEADLSSLRSFAIPAEKDLEFFGDDEQASLYSDAIARLERSGAKRISIDFAPFRETANLLYQGPWLAERLAAVSEFLDKKTPDVHPVTRKILEGGAQFSAVDYFKALKTLESLRKKCLRVFSQAEVLVVPTMPTIPTAAAVKADSAAWSPRMGYYTNFANLLRLAGIAVPSGFTPSGLPGGITMLAQAGSEPRLCELGMAWQRLVNLPLGATGKHLAAAKPHNHKKPVRVADGEVRVAVAGAHLRGQPLHADLQRLGAHFVRACKTAASYRFMAFMDLRPPKPGLLPRRRSLRKY